MPGNGQSLSSTQGTPVAIASAIVAADQTVEELTPCQRAQKMLDQALDAFGEGSGRADKSYGIGTRNVVWRDPDKLWDAVIKAAQLVQRLCGSTPIADAILAAEGAPKARRVILRDR
jgi:hypothetical protein